MCGCGGGGANRAVQAPKLPVNNSPTSAVTAAALHPSVQHMQAVQRLAEERRKVERLRREQLLNRIVKK
jgi:hypothetical protein